MKVDIVNRPDDYTLIRIEDPSESVLREIDAKNFPNVPHYLVSTVGNMHYIRFPTEHKDEVIEGFSFIEPVPIHIKGKNHMLNLISSGKKVINYFVKQGKTECPLLEADVEVIDILGKGADGTAIRVKSKKWGTKNIVLKTFVEGPEEYCLESEPMYKEDFDFTVPAGSYSCQDSFGAELIMSGITNSFLDQSANFLAYFDFFLCREDYEKFGGSGEVSKRGDENEFSMYFLMELASTDLYHLNRKCNKTITEEMSHNLLFQTLHAVTVFQKLKINHNDLHEGNIFIQKIEADTRHNGQKLIDADYFHYRLGKTDYYLPYIPVLVKIADWGRAMKWSEPYVLNEDIHSIIPHKYVPESDSYMVMNAFTRLFDDRIARPYGLEEYESKEYAGRILPKFLPKIQKPKYLAENIIKDNFKMWTKKPTSGKIVMLGVS